MALYHSARGSVDYTIVGSPTIVDGVASDFSSSNYLKTPILQLSSVNSFEINLKISADNPDGTYTQIAGNNNTVAFQFGGSIKKLYAYVLDSNGQSALTYTYNHQSEISTIKLVYQNSTYSLYINGNFIESLAKGLPTTDYPFGLGTKMYGNSSGDGFLGSIDLNNTYITVNGQPWFGICPVEVKKHQIMGPVGYTVVGSPTITDGVASGFSSSNYFCTTEVLQANQDNLYIKIKFKTPTSFPGSTTNIVFFGNTLTNNNCIRLYYSQGAGAYFSVFNIDAFSGQNLLSVNSWYTIEVIIIEGSFVFNLYDSNMIKIGTKTATISTLDLNGIGYFGGKYSNCIGSIDLNETYIKVNGKLWFWQPQETKRIVVNGVEVWTKPE